jgi:hypothetical protein
MIQPASPQGASSSELKAPQQTGQCGPDRRGRGVLGAEARHRRRRAPRIRAQDPLEPGRKIEAGKTSAIGHEPLMGQDRAAGAHHQPSRRGKVRKPCVACDSNLTVTELDCAGAEVEPV